LIPSTRRRAVLLVLVLQTASACSLAMKTPPDPIVAPSEPVSCNSSLTAPVLDMLCAGIFLSTTISLARAKTCSSDPFNVECIDSGDRNSAMLVTGSLAALCAVGSAVGFQKADRCERVKNVNALCIKGDEAACLKLNSAWKPPMRAPDAAPTTAPQAPPVWPAPANGGCVKDVDCKGDRICEQGVCVPPRVKEAP
jgi:hypothetical protein